MAPDIVNLPPFPRLTRGEFWWEGYDTLPTHRGHVTNDQEISEVQLCVMAEDPEMVPRPWRYPEPAPRQVQTYQFIRSNFTAILDAALDAVVCAYPRIVAEYEEADGNVMPRILSASDLRPLVSLKRIEVLESARGNLAYVNLAFTCEWDHEHGLGIAMHGLRVMAVGPDDIAEVWWPAKDGGTWVWAPPKIA